MRWLIDNIGTAAYNEVYNNKLYQDCVILDVRDLVDKSGNDSSYIQTKITECLSLLHAKSKVIICCDYGMSRSNSIAIGSISKWLKIEFDEAVEIVKSKVDESGIKIEMLDTVYKALNIISNKTDKTENILVTGGSGFLGITLIDKLSIDFKVVAPRSKEIDLIHDTISLDLLIKKNSIDTIIHLANPKIFTTNKSTGDTLVMLKNILDICRTNDVKLIFLSGWEIYSGYKSLGLLANESLKPNPKGTYGETKWLCELLIRKYIENYNIKCQIIRSGPVYGMNGDKPKFIFNFINKALAADDIVTHKYLNGFPCLDLLYVDDLIDLIIKVCKSNVLEDV
nr:NAD-dependent epimerase/dehydratase family protein [Chitinophagaceae bacterium]